LTARLTISLSPYLALVEILIFILKNIIYLKLMSSKLLITTILVVLVVI